MIHEKSVCIINSEPSLYKDKATGPVIESEYLV